MNLRTSHSFLQQLALWSRQRVNRLFSISVVGLLVLAGCGGTDANRFSGEMSGRPVMEYTIGPSDVLTVNVRGHEDLNTTVTVRPDGMITFPLLGEVYVVGRTPAGLQNALAESLREYVNIMPREVSIVIDEVHSYAVSVLGEVRNPGRYQFQSQITVLDALAQAGGLTEFASRRDIQILRPGAEGMQRINFNYRDVMRAEANISSQMYLYPGDTVLVP